MVPHEATNVDRKLQDLKQFAKKNLAKNMESEDQNANIPRDFEWVFVTPHVWLTKSLH